jgi:MFS family permease
VSNIQSNTAGVGSIKLSAGISPFNFWTYMYASFICIGMMSTMNFAQGYILTEHLHVPPQEVGSLSGRLTGLTEIVGFLLIWPFGMLADRTGRRPIIIFGILTIGLVYAIYPWATEPFHLYVFRLLYGVGVAATAAMTATIQNDYPQERSRGKLIGASAVFNGLGIVFASNLVGRMPSILRDQGVDPVAAGTIAYTSAALLCLISALWFRFGLKGGTPAAPQARPPYRQLLWSGLKAARNPRIALGYLSAMTARGDVVIMGTFVSLWSITAGGAAGLNPGQAMARAATSFIVIQVAAIVWSLVFGGIIDRINRVSALAMAMAIAAGGYCSMAFITSPMDIRMAPVFAIVGAGMSAAMMATFAVIGQEARPEERGAVTGTMSMFGALGIILAAVIGGQIFDSIAPWAPFVLVGSAQAVLMIGAIAIRVLAPGESGTPTEKRPSATAAAKAG